GARLGRADVQALAPSSGTALAFDRQGAAQLLQPRAGQARAEGHRLVGIEGRHGPGIHSRPGAGYISALAGKVAGQFTAMPVIAGCSSLRKSSVMRALTSVMSPI